MTTRKTKIIISTWWQLGRAKLVYVNFIFFKLIIQEHSCKIVYGEFIFVKFITWGHSCTLVFLHSIVIFVDVWKITRLNTNSNIMMTRRTKMVISLFSFCWPSCLSYDGEGDSSTSTISPTVSNKVHVLPSVLLPYLLHCEVELRSCPHTQTHTL